MTEKISDERLAELIAEEKRIAESRADEALEVEWAKDVLAALHELAEYRKREEEGTVEYGLRDSTGRVDNYGEYLMGAARDRWAGDVVVRRTVTKVFGEWEKVRDGD